MRQRVNTRLLVYRAPFARSALFFGECKVYNLEPKLGVRPTHYVLLTDMSCLHKEKSFQSNWLDILVYCDALLPPYNSTVAVQVTTAIAATAIAETTAIAD